MHLKIDLLFFFFNVVLSQACMFDNQLTGFYSLLPWPATCWWPFHSKLRPSANRTRLWPSPSGTEKRTPFKHKLIFSPNPAEHYTSPQSCAMSTTSISAAQRQTLLHAPETCSSCCLCFSQSGWWWWVDLLSAENQPWEITI